MQIFAYSYIFFVVLVFFMQQQGMPEAPMAMKVLHYGFAIVTFAIAMMLLSNGRRLIRETIVLVTIALLLVGVAFKLSYIAYADEVMLIAAGMVLVAEFIRSSYARNKKSPLGRLSLIALPIFLVAGVVWSMPYNQIFRYYYQSKIVWNTNQRINWEAFQGTPQAGSKYDATIFSNIHYQYRIEGDSLFSVVAAYFDPSKSWHREGTEPLLEHEKLHFDITEVYAAKLREIFHEARVEKNYKRFEIQRSIDKLLIEWDEIQALYDQQTDHGLEYRKQLVWQHAVDSLLSQYGSSKQHVERFTAYFNSEDTIAFNKDQPMYTVVDTMPNFIGGRLALQNYIDAYLQYPKVAKDYGITGSVYVNFIVDAAGAIQNPKVIRGIGGGCESEALRIVKMMPKWEPGIDKGKPVEVQITLPIKFPPKAEKS